MLLTATTSSLICLSLSVAYKVRLWTSGLGPEAVSGRYHRDRGKRPAPQPDRQWHQFVGSFRRTIKAQAGCSVVSVPGHRFGEVSLLGSELEIRHCEVPFASARRSSREGCSLASSERFGQCPLSQLLDVRIRVRQVLAGSVSMLPGPVAK